MSRGYIVIAQNSGDTDYLRMAYGLALSLKATQTTVSNLCVCVDKGTVIPKKYLEVFDQHMRLKQHVADFARTRHHYQPPFAHSTGCKDRGSHVAKLE